MIVNRLLGLGAGCVVALIATAGQVRADAVLTGRSTEITATAKAFGSPIFSESDGPSRSQTRTSNGFDPFNDSASASSASPFTTTADSNATQGSSFVLTGPGSILNSANAGGNLSAEGVTSAGGLALSSALSDFFFDFDVTGAPAQYTLSGGFTSTQPGAIYVALYNQSTPGTDIYFIQDSDPGASNFTTSGTLPVGSYTVELSGFLFVNNSGGTQSHSAGYTFDFVTGVPEPTTVWFAVAGASILMRRRRCAV